MGELVSRLKKVYKNSDEEATYKNTVFGRLIFVEDSSVNIAAQNQTGS